MIRNIYALAVSHHRAGRLVEAEGLYRQVLSVQPANASALQMLGVVANQLGRYDEAIGLLRRAIEVDPRNAPAHSNLGLVLAGREKWEEARAAFERAIALRPEFADAHNNLGNVLKSLGRIAEAIAGYRRAVELNGGFANAWTNLGTTLWENGEAAEAVDCFGKVLTIQPADAQARVYLAGALRDCGKLEESIEAGLKAVAMRPGWEDATFTVSLSRLHVGDFARGWGDFEAFWERRLGREEYRRFPRWDGSALEGGRILLHLNHGFGDTIQLVRYAPLIAAMGGRVTLRCQPELMGIMSSVAGIERVIGHDDPLPSTQVQCSLLTLPRILRSTVATIPATVPYLRADPERVRFWRERMANEPAALRVGLNWAGSPLFREDRFRSMKLQTLAPLAGMERIRFYSVQKGPAGAEGKTPPAGMNLVDWTEQLRDFADTAALMMNLDLVVSSDTSVVHLAGALGRPVWVMLHYVPGCFWLLNRADSPWYPTMRLFRQRKPGDWMTVVQEVAGELTRWRGRH